MSDTPQSLPSGHVPGVLLAYHLKALKLPTFLREYDKMPAMGSMPSCGRRRRTSA